MKRNIAGNYVLRVLFAALLVMVSVFGYGQKYSNGKVPGSVSDKSRIAASQLRKGTKPNQVLMTLGDSTLKFVDADTAAVIARPYKVYTALLSQTGTSAPTAVVLENTIGTVTITRDGAGIYYITKTGAFVENKTFVVVGTYYEGVAGSPINIGAIWYDENSVQVSAGDNTEGLDDILYKTSIEIRVYN